MKEEKEYDFDVALSFAGEDRAYVESVAIYLSDHGVKVFYDLFEEVNLWGKNLYEYLSEIYNKKSHFTVMFISKHYSSKAWTNHERKAMQSRAFEESKEYILPARFDDSEVPGQLPVEGYISLKGMEPDKFAQLIIQKLKSFKS